MIAAASPLGIGVTLRRPTDDPGSAPLSAAASCPGVAGVVPHICQAVLKDRRDARGFYMHSPHEGGIRVVREEHEAHDEHQRQNPGPDRADNRKRVEWTHGSRVRLTAAATH